MFDVVAAGLPQYTVRVAVALPPYFVPLILPSAIPVALIFVFVATMMRLCRFQSSVSHDQGLPITQ